MSGGGDLVRIGLGLAGVVFALVLWRMSRWSRWSGRKEGLTVDNEQERASRLILSGFAITVVHAIPGESGQAGSHTVHSFTARSRNPSPPDYLVEADLRNVPTAALEVVASEIARELSRRADIRRIASDPLFDGRAL